jgi:hypothetical protein
VTSTILTPRQFFRAQHGEDVWLEEHWGASRLPDEAGVFAEFGAGDGEFCSNTYFLEHGPRRYTGLLCEPDPRHEGLEEKRPRSVIERCAVGPADTISLGLCNDPYLSGELRNRPVKEPSVDRRLRVPKRLDVLQVPLTRLLKRHHFTELHLLSIDTEGTEKYAFESLDLKLYRPRVVIVELSTWGLESQASSLVRANEMKLALDCAGYEMVHQTQCNGIFFDRRQ